MGGRRWRRPARSSARTPRRRCDGCTTTRSSSTRKCCASWSRSPAPTTSCSAATTPSTWPPRSRPRRPPPPACGPPRRPRCSAATRRGCSDWRCAGERGDDRGRRRGRAGHNSLITAAYLAAAGYEVVALDARAIPGGGAASEELLLPGYRIDSCSTGHTLIQTNPLLADDELGLQADYGLEYLVPDPFAHVAFPDGRHLTMWMDLERSCEEIARFSRADADAYRRMLADYDDVKGVFGAATFTPPGFGPSLEQRLAEHPKGPIWQRKRMMSAWDVIRHEFESDHVRAFLLWQAFQTLVPIDMPGSGQLAASIVFGRQRRSWTLPRGGSGALTDALVRYVEDRGGAVLCDRPVGRLLVENGRCVGVATEGGEEFRAREAVVSTIHVKHLLDMAPAECWDEDFRYGVDTFDVGLSGFSV